MKKLSKILSAILTAIMLLAMLPAGVAAHADSGTCGDNLTWTLENGVLTISGTGQMWDYDIWGENPVPWDNALKSVVISEGVTSVGCYAFYGCNELTSISIPGSMKNINVYALSGCAGLTDLTIPDGVKTLEYEAFSGCVGISRVEIPDSVEWLGEYLFSGCMGLTSVSIGSGVKSAGGGMFSNCPSLESITVSENNTRYHSVDNCLIDTEYGYLLAGCKNSVIPADGSVRSISESAFEGCTGLTSVSIPEGVVNIGQLAFSGCTGLTSAEILDTSDTIFFIGAWAFENCSNLKSITILSRNTGISTEAFVSWKDENGDGEREAYYPTTLRIYEGSRAHQYALANGIPYEFIGGSTAKGDPDGDGQITVADALSALRVAARLVESTDALIASCDIDGDGVITVADALSILRVAAKLADPSSLDGAEPNALSYIEMATLPKTVYVQGEWLDVSGGELKLCYNDGSYKTVTLYTDMVSGFDSSVIGTQTLTVTYEGETTTFEVTVNAKAISYIRMKTLPKTEYFVGESLDVTGGELTLWYNDNTFETVALTADMVSGFDSSATGTRTLTVTYEGKTAKYAITVMEQDSSEKVTVKIETVEASAGAAEVEVKLIISASPKWNSIAAKITFEPAALTYKGHSVNPVINSKMQTAEAMMLIVERGFAEDGMLMIAFASDEEDGNAYEYIITMKFDVAAGVSGLQAINVAVDALKDRENTDVPFAAVNGGIIVA